MRSFLSYTLARLVLFLAASGLAYLFGARYMLALLIGLVISAPVSYVLLTRQRDALSASILQSIARFRGISQRLDEGSRKEDQTETGHEAATETGTEQQPEFADPGPEEAGEESGTTEITRTTSGDEGLAADGGTTVRGE